MRAIETPRFGLVRYDEQEVIAFPLGLPGFENENEFLLIEPAESKPLCFLQSVLSPEICFICSPVELLDPHYKRSLGRQDRASLGLDSDVTASTSELSWFAILCFQNPDSPTANLLGPIVVRRNTRAGVQAIREDSAYSARQPMFREGT
jgi:flagellar assembly factor FliW